MILECPQCKTKVKVPQNAIGKKARCSRCKTVFIAEEDSDVDVVVLEPDPEEPEVGVPISEDSESEAFEVPRAVPPPLPRRKAASDDLDADPQIELPPPTRKQAASEMRFAARVMLVAAISSCVAIGFGEYNTPGRGELNIIAMLFGYPLLAFIIFCVFRAGALLYSVGSRTWIIVGIIANFIILALFALAVVGYLISLYHLRNRQGRDVAAINQTIFSIALIYGLAALANFFAAVFATIAILKSNVRRWYRRDA